MKSFKQRFIAVILLLGNQTALSNPQTGIGVGLLSNQVNAYYDVPRVLENKFSIGGEVILAFSDGLALGVRGFVWEKPTEMAGFFGGPKIHFGITDDGLKGAVGAEGGWQYRFQERFGISPSINIFFANHSLFVTDLRLNINYWLS